MNPASNMPKKGARRTCEICGIKEAHSADPLFFANFPLDENRCKEWVRVSGNEDLALLPIEKLHTIKHVCGVHFKPKDFSKSGKRLKKHAVPSMNLTSSPLSSDQMTSFPLHLYSQNTPSTSKQHIQVRLYEDAASVDVKDNSASTLAASCSNTLPNLQVRQPKNAPSISKEEKSDTDLAASCSNVLQNVQETTPTKRHGVSAAGSLETGSRGVKRQLMEDEEFTPRKKKLVERLVKTKCTLNSLKKSSILIEKIESPVLRELVVNACKNEKRKPKGRRWTTQHKISCLAIMKRSPKTYGYLSAAVTLPSIKTLRNILKKIPVQPGISQAVMKQLKSVAKEKNEKEKLCCLAFDEMAIKSRLIYDEAGDKVEGYEDLGEAGRTQELADHALVFLLQGLYKKFKQPIAFYFTKGTIASAQLAVIIKKIITEVSACGFTIVNTVCDQGPTNMGALKILREQSGPCEDASNHHFSIDGKKTYIVYDVPHLFKSIRNNFLNTGNMELNGTKAKWDHLIELETHNRNILYLNKISPAHVNPKYRSKMRVMLAAQLLSNTTAAVLTLMARAEKETKAMELQGTAKVVRELDLLFDITNGPSGPQDRKKGIRTNVSANSKHMDQWADFIKKLKDTKFINKNGAQSKNVKCIDGYLTTLKSLRDIWQVVSAQGFTYLNLRNLNQDALENLFGVIRQHSPTNRNPTAAHFIAALKTAIVTGLTAPHSRGSNCEKDKKRLMTDFHNLVFEDDKPEKENMENAPSAMGVNTDPEPAVTDNIDEDTLQNIFHIPDEDITETDFTLLTEQPTVYVAGYLAHQILKKIKCNDCLKYLTVSNPDDNPRYSYIMLREWWKDKFSLTYPSTNFCETVKSLVEKTENELLPNMHQTNICLLGCTLYALDSPNLQIACNLHAIEVTKICHTKACKLLIRRQCQRVNQNLARKEESLSNLVKKAEQVGQSK